MSSTNRGAQRVESDFYPTPETAFKPLLPYLEHAPQPIWEPACGDGRLIDWMSEFGIYADGDDLNNGYDFLKDETQRATILTNPAYSIALQFCNHAYHHSKHSFQLIRLGFLASRERKNWFRAHKLSALFILSERPGFVMSCKCKKCKAAWTMPIESERPRGCLNAKCDGKIQISTSDSADYGWAYWANKEIPLHTGIHHL